MVFLCYVLVILHSLLNVVDSVQCSTLDEQQIVPLIELLCCLQTVKSVRSLQCRPNFNNIYIYIRAMYRRPVRSCRGRVGTAKSSSLLFFERNVYL